MDASEENEIMITKINGIIQHTEKAHRIMCIMIRLSILAVLNL